MCSVLNILPWFLPALLFQQSSAAPPNIVHIMVDDLGWRYRPGNDNPERVTPHLDALLAEGLALDRFYAHKICSPSRSALLSGRAPIHVNVENVGPEVRNAADPVGGFQGIPPDMTLVSQLMRQGGYATHFVGKWDVGMATERHHPKNRGFDSWTGYWHHSNDYWQHTEGACQPTTSGDTIGTGAAMVPIVTDGVTAGATLAGNVPVRDLWRFNASGDGPATDLANDPRCSQLRQRLPTEATAGQRCALSSQGRHKTCSTP